MKTLLSLLAVAVVAAAIGVHHWRAGLAARPEFRTLPATRGELLIAVTATGTVEPVEIVDVGAQISGRIQSFGPDANRPGKTVDYGSRVTKDMLLAQMDDSPHKAELDKAKAALRLVKAEQQRVNTRLRQLERDVDRARKLQDTISKGEFENVQSEYEISKADAAMSEAKVEQAQIVAKQAEINLGYATILSPVDGVVIDRRVNIGQTVVAGLNAPTLFLLARDLSHMLVWSAVNEADIGDIHEGQRVKFRVDAFRDRTYEGKVSQIRLNASLSSNVVSYGVVVDVDNQDGSLLPYMTAKLQFEVALRSDALLVPNQALRWRPTWEQISPAAREGLTPPNADASRTADKKDGLEEETESSVEVAAPTVWVVAEDGLVRPVAVQVGLTDGIVTEVTDGDLSVDSKVVVNVARKAKPDFVSSFITKVVGKK